jgi:hypothetical protein
MPSYTQLDEAQIIRTIEDIRDRMAARFPQAGLLRVSEQFLGVAKEVARCEAYLRRPNWPMRALGGVAIAALTILLVAIVTVAVRAPAEMSIGDVIQTIEAAVNDIVFFGIAVFFVMTIETRVKRRRALAMLHELRSLAHIVDMHQLTKDPEWVLPRGRETGIVAPRQLSPFELSRYLDYCSETLSLTGKVAVLYIQDFPDDVALAAVNEVEELTNALSRKIWQKLMILHGLRPESGGLA